MRILLFLLVSLSYALTGSPYGQNPRPSGDLAKDLNYFYRELQIAHDRIQTIYLKNPEQLKEEKLEAARVIFYQAQLQYQKALKMMESYQETYGEKHWLMVQSNRLQKLYSDIYTYMDFIFKMNPLDLYARHYALKPGKLMEERKFLNIKTKQWTSGSELVEKLKKAYRAYHIRTKTTLTQAEKILLPLIEQYPDFLPAHFWLSRVYFDQDRVEESGALLKRIAEVDPNLVLAKAFDAKMLSEDDLIEYARPVEPDLPQDTRPLIPLQNAIGPKTESFIRVPFALVIENSKDSRPQQGLNLAEVVYEFPVETGHTRLLALYGVLNERDKQKAIGPIHALKDYFLDQIYSFNPMIVHSGSSPEAYRLKLSLDYYTLDELSVPQIFEKDPQRPQWENVFTSMENILEIAYSRQRIPASPSILFKYSGAGYPYEENRAIAVHVPFPKMEVSWKYNSGLHAFERFIGGRLQIDANENLSIRAANLVMQYTAQKRVDDLNRLEIQTVGKGQAQIFAGGKQIHGFWRKENIHGPTLYLDQAGKEIALIPGHTWVSFLPAGGKIRVEKLDYLQ